MRRRNSTISHGIGRRKSVSSVKSVHLEYIHPDTAERDAQTAAAQAFARARQRSATDTTLWPPPRNSGSNGTSSYAGTPERRSGDSGVRRQQSVRFVRKGTLQATPSCSSADNMTPTRNPSRVRLRATRNGIAHRPASSASASGMISAAKGTAGDYINAFITGEEYYTPEDDIASAPSSYRRIRKSRSMFTSSETSTAPSRYLRENAISTTVSHMDELPISSAASSIIRTDENIPHTRLKAPKSMSFLKSRRDQSSQLLQSQPSGFLHSKSTGNEKSLRKSMRDASDGTLPSSLKYTKDGSLRNRARKASQTFKHKLKKFFSLVKGENDENAFPPQQIEASKVHTTDLDSPNHNGDSEFQFETATDEAALSRVASGVPSLHAVPSCQQLRSRQGSVESLRSEIRASDDRSRVTSWTNSDTNTFNTLGSHAGEWDRPRLSVIKENGMHVSSSSARRNGVINPFEHPNTSVSAVQPRMPPPPATVDSQRIYSALMKRLDETQRQRSVEDFVKSGVVPPRGSSLDCEGQGHNTPATIRHVVSDSRSDSASMKTIERKVVPSTNTVTAEQNRPPLRASAESVSERQALSSSASINSVHKTKQPKVRGNTGCSVSHVEERPSLVRTLSARSSAFFASPTYHLFRTESPYRRALQDSMKTEQQNAQPKSPEYNPWMRSLTNLPIRCPSTCESEVDKKMQYAESIYSSTTDELVTGSNKTSVLVDNFPRPPSAHGDATIFVDRPVYRPTPPSPLKHRVTSSASSVEWKTWLSANVSKLERPPDHPSPSELEFAIPTARFSGHIREEAQIHDDDEQASLEVYEPTRPESALATIEHNARQSPPRIIVKNKSPIPNSDKENEAPEALSFPFQRRLRTVPSVTSISSTKEASKTPIESAKKGAFHSISRESLKHTPSLNAIAGNQPRSNSSLTTKLVRKQPRTRNNGTPKSSPGLAAAVDRQFGKADDAGGSKHKLGIAASAKNENVDLKSSINTDEDPYSIQGSGILGPEPAMNPQSVGSKRMVDIFLSSRRKRMASSEEDGGVFL
ncbi:hypothetical protein F4779DRAFT_294643 [Xylariaceae sp. FL0662B]|nr:hypothetical protein F4779DRAFT_294643 [Xylariaceae sp. FL0662B]